MKLKQLRLEFLAALGEALGQDGFVRREQSFERPMAAGRAILHVSFVNHAGDVDVTLDVAVQYETPRASGRDGAVIGVLGAQLENIAGDNLRRWTLRERADIPVIVTAVHKRFTDIALPFIARYSEPGEALKVLDEGGAEAALISPIRHAREATRDALRAQISEGAI